MAFIFSFLTGAIGRYIMIGVAIFAAIAWIRHDAAAPYKREIAALRQAAASSLKLAEADQARAKQAEIEKAEIQQMLQVVIDETNQEGTACKLSAGELKRLRNLAASN